ncbi:hypothetical protein GCM10010094_92700 [Streptomyces flaveus]|uniref:Uncharacterized protein n=1 Tax=Streptomyces flaveus TaxID=66370 RepID=A0A917RPN7_9ACTN|nr:hypothetical protein GCM10010094_92700 [Streptomyces flaveus]
MIGVDAGSGDRMALGVLTQYRMATTAQMHRVIAPSVRIEQTRRRLARLRSEGLVDRITLPQAGRTWVWFPTQYGVQLALEWPELRGHRPSRTVSDPTAVRLKAGRTLTETALVFLEDARRRGDVCEPLDWICEVHHPIRSGGAVIPDALLYYQRGPAHGDNGSMLRAFVEVDRATMGPERLADKLTAYERLHRYVPVVPADCPGTGAGGVAAALPAPPPRGRPGPGRGRTAHAGRPRRTTSLRRYCREPRPAGFLRCPPSRPSRLLLLWRPGLAQHLRPGQNGTHARRGRSGASGAAAAGVMVGGP